MEQYVHGGRFNIDSRLSCRRSLWHPK